MEISFVTYIPVNILDRQKPTAKHLILFCRNIRLMFIFFIFFPFHSVLYSLMGALCLIATLYDFIFIMMTPDPEEEAEPHMNGHAHSNGDLRKDGEGAAADTEILIHPQGKTEAPKRSKSSSNACSKCLFFDF